MGRRVTREGFEGNEGWWQIRNDQGNRAAARNLEIQKTRRPPLRLTALFALDLWPTVIQAKPISDR